MIESFSGAEYCSIYSALYIWMPLWLNSKSITCLELFWLQRQCYGLCLWLVSTSHFDWCRQTFAFEELFLYRYDCILQQSEILKHIVSRDLYLVAYLDALVIAFCNTPNIIEKSIICSDLFWLQRHSIMVYVCNWSLLSLVISAEKLLLLKSYFCIVMIASFSRAKYWSHIVTFI